MKYYSENTVKGLLEQLDSHFVKYLDNLPSIEVKEPHGMCIDADKLTDTIVRCIKDAEKEYPEEDFELVKMVYESCLYHIAEAPTILKEKEE